MNTTIALNKKHFQTASKQARKLGTTPEAYIESLIDRASRTFDDLLAPARKGFQNLSDDDLDTLFHRANQAARKQMKARK